MTELTADHFESLCRQGPVQSQIDTLQTTRSEALKKFWMYLIGGIVLSLVLTYALLQADMVVAATICLMLFLFGGIIMSVLSLTKASSGIKKPVLEAIASQGGLTYTLEKFDPPAGGGLNLLFGSTSSAVFTDLFQGTDAEGQGYAIYEAELTKGHGKSRRIVFRGQVYAFQRRPRSEGVTAVTPDKGIFNFFKPARDMERVKFDMDAAFEKKFEVYSTHPQEARMQFDQAAMRERLMEMRAAGTVYGFISPEEALFAIAGKNRFEPGSMFRSTGGRERVQAMFNDVCASLDILKKLRETFA
jgi:hypothetical protein